MKNKNIQDVFYYWNMPFEDMQVKNFKKENVDAWGGRIQKILSVGARGRRSEKCYKSVWSLNGTTCTMTFDARAHGMFIVGVNIWKWPKQQVQENATQSTNAKYKMLHAPT